MNTRPLRNTLSSFLLVIAIANHVAAADGGQDWPCFLGPNGNNTSTETNLLDRWPAKGPPLLWEKQVGSGYSAPSVRDGLLVLHHRLGDEEIVEAMDAATGKTKWQHKDPSRFRDPFGYNNGPRCTPVLSSNTCFTFGAEGKLNCLALAVT